MHDKAVTLTNVTKAYGDFLAVDGVSLVIQRGEFLSLLGPSGCGKTTTLRIVAGFITPDDGQVHIGDQEITVLPPNRRDIGLVFQNYALWPHMTVAENIAFGLKLKGMSRAAIDDKIKEVMDLTNLSGLEPRFPRELSGGQQQRVAVARALALDRSVLLMDEPLSNLDRKLRVDMRRELKQLQRRLGITTLYVTHDQEEALSMSDRVAVMDSGRVAHIAPPDEIYRMPPNQFVAEFVGNVNFLDGKVTSAARDRATFRTGDGLEFVVAPKNRKLELGPVRLMVRPEWMELCREGDAESNLFPAQIEFIEYFGSNSKFIVRLGGGTSFVIQTQNSELAGYKVGDQVFVHIDVENFAVIR